MNTMVGLSLMSIIIPLAGYAIFFLTGVAPAGIPEPRVYLSLISLNTVGVAFSVVALSRSNPKPLDVSAPIRLMVLFSTVGLLINSIAAQCILAAVLPVLIQPAA